MNLLILKGAHMAFKIVYKICCGIDVHKTFVVACIASTNDKGVTSYESHRFSTYTSSLNHFRNQYQHGGFSLGETLMLMGRSYSDQQWKCRGKKSVRVSKAGCYIKPLLVQCANAVVTSKKHPEIRNRYLRLKKRRGHKKAIIAIARMLLTALYHMLKNGENYNAELYRKYDLPPVDREITVEQAIIIARNQGYKIKSATA